jgi:hypothetical protein
MSRAGTPFEHVEVCDEDQYCEESTTAPSVRLSSSTTSRLVVVVFFFTLQEETGLTTATKKPEELAALRETWPTQLDPDTLASLFDHLLHSTPFRWW